MIGDESLGREALSESLDSDSPFLRVAGAWALLKLAPREPRLARRSIQRVLDGLASDDPHVRLAAAQQLGNLGYDTGMPEILDVFEKNLLKNTSPADAERINVMTALAIGSVCSRDLNDYLPKLLKNRSKQVQLAAAEAILKCNKFNN